MKAFLTLFVLGSLAFSGAGADDATAVRDLIPRLADPDVPARYAAQMELQDLASQSSQPGQAARREALGRVLAARAADPATPLPARVWMVRQLEYMGGAEAVPSLASLLAGDEPELRDCARRALEKNPAPEASASLRHALEKAGEAREQIGLIHSLGQRADAAAVPLIARHLEREATAATAAMALGRIATPAAAAALGPLLGRNPAAGEGLMEAASRMSARGDIAAAQDLYRRLWGAENPVALRAAALSGMETAAPAVLRPMLREALDSNEPRLQQVAIRIAGGAGARFGRMLLNRYAALPAASKAQVLGVLDSSAEPRIIEAVQEPDPDVRRAAIEALGRVGGSAAVPALLNIAGADGPDKNAAVLALARISGEGAAAEIRKSAGAGPANLRVAALNALADRGQAAAVPVLIEAAAEPDAAVRKAAWAALGKLGAEREIEAVGGLVARDKSPEASAAIEAIAARVADKEAAARKLLALAGGREAELAAMANAISVLGADAGLAALERLAASGGAGSQERALVALGRWPTLDAAKPLLEIARRADAPERARSLAIEGVARLVESLDRSPVDARAEAALAALAAAKQDADKKAVLGALATVPHPESARAIQAMLGDAKFRNDAAQAGIELAELLVTTHRELAHDLARAIQQANISATLGRRAGAVLRR